MIRQDFLTPGPNRPGIQLHSVQAIIIHWTANLHPGATADANRRYFNRGSMIRSGKRIELHGNKPFRYGSAHYIVDEKEVVQCIPEHEVAYHVGDAASKVKFPVPANHCTLGIELCVNGDFVKTLRRAVWLIGDELMLRHPYAKIGRHYDITGKKCPHMYLPSVVDGKNYDWAWDTFIELLRARNVQITKL